MKVLSPIDVVTKEEKIPCIKRVRRTVPDTRRVRPGAGADWKVTCRIVAVVAGLQVLDTVAAIQLAYKRGLKPLPYRSTNCLNIYAKSVEDVIRFGEEVGAKVVAIVNTVWYCSPGRKVKYINIRQATKCGFVPVTYVSASGRYSFYPVTIYYTGTIRVHHAMTFSEAADVAGSVLDCLQKIGAVKE